jgi:hypothetical protein
MLLSMVDQKVNSDKMPETCNTEFILGGGRCEVCAKSPQLEYMSAKDLLQNIYVK